MGSNIFKNLHNLEIPQKQAMLGIVFMVTSVFFWGLLTYSMALRVTGSVFLGSLMLLGLVWACIYGLLVLFADKRITYFSYIFLGFLLMILYGFYDFNFIGVLIFALVLFIAHFRAERFRNFIADFRPYHIIRRFMPLFFTGLAIMLAFVYNSYILKYYVEDPRISKDVYSVVFIPVEYSMELMFTDYERGMSIREFQGILVDSFFVRFLPAESVGEFDSSYFPDFFGEEAADATLEELSLVWLNNTISTMLALYMGILPALFILGLFLVLRSILLPFLWLTIGILLLVIRLLLVYNIITFEEINTIKKVPVLE